jgi:predicted amidohydrolase YtcJ
MIEPDQIERLAKLGVDLTVSMSFSWGKGELIAERVGEHMHEHLVPLRRLLDAGLRIGCGSDWGRPRNVFEQMALAIEPHYAASGRNAATAGMDRRAALAGWTRGAGAGLGGNRVDCRRT